MSKQTDEKKGKGINITRAIAAAKDLLVIGVSEVRLQMMLDRYQLANMKMEFTETERVRRVNKLRAQAEKLDKKFAGAINEETGKPYERVANWKPVANYFNETLAHVKKTDFAKEAGEKAADDIAKFSLSKVTKEQEDTIILYHRNRAEQSWESVEQIRALLEYKGLLKKAPAKLPTEDELAKIAAGQE